MEHAEQNSSFPVTQWTTLIRPIQTGSPEASVALNRLCELYRPPVLQYFRRRGVDPHQAEDLTQDFFASLLRNEIWKDIDRSRGLFRCFLATRLRWFFLNHCNQAEAPIEPSKNLDEMPSSEANQPDNAFDSAWAWALIRSVLAQLEKGWEARNRSIPFGALVGFLTTEAGEAPIAKLAKDYGMTPNALYQSVFRLRNDYATLLTASVAMTVESPEEVKAEISYLMERVR